jgi:hypothetical protein
MKYRAGLVFFVFLFASNLVLREPAAQAGSHQARVSAAPYRPTFSILSFRATARESDLELPKGGRLEGVEEFREYALCQADSGLLTRSSPWPAPNHSCCCSYPRERRFRPKRARSYVFPPRASFPSISLNSFSSLIRSNAGSSNNFAFVIPLSTAFFNPAIARFLSFNCAYAVASR